MNRTRLLVPAVFLFTLAGVHTPAHAQFSDFGKKLKQKLEQKVDQRVDSKTDKAMDAALDQVECAATDTKCVEQAKAQGKKVKTVDSASSATTPPSGSADTASAKSQPATLKPGQGAWANFDFKPGDRILIAEDFAKDEVGDFPRRFEFRSGQIEIVEWSDARWLRATNGKLWIPLPETLPERFTVEFDLTGNGNPLVLAFDGKDDGNTAARMEFGEYFGRLRQGEIDAQGEYGAGVKTTEKPVHIAISVDGEHVKAYANEKRIYNAPNVKLGRSNKIFVNMNGWSAELPRMIANVRIAAGGKKLYDALAEKGRVATQGVLFDTGSDRIRPESTPTLKEMGAMLKEHPDLKLVIEGHTDDVGAAANNQSLSEKRAAAVREYLVATYGVEKDRLQAKGFGASKPSAGNDTPEGRQQNRRVELVRI
ncbi:MAG TPA: OmpA family protein [Steroidobacteraceae bacterium]|nr:OmpA family protein [Steroidobacteraceae bacterium]